MATAKDSVQKTTIDPRLLRRLLHFAKPHARGFILSSILLILLAALTLTVPMILGDAVDQYLVGDEAARLSVEERKSGVFNSTMLLAVLGVLIFGVRFTQILITNRTGQKVIHDLRRAVYSHINGRNLRFFDSNPVGTLVTRVTGDIETLNEFFVSGIDVLLSDLLRIVAISVVLFVIDWQMAAATLATVPLILLWAFVFQKRARRLFREVREQISLASGQMNEIITGVKVIHAFRREQATQFEFGHVNRALKDAHVQTVKNFSWFFPGMEFLTALGMSAVLVTGYYLTLGGQVQPGEVVKFWLYLKLFIEPLRQLADKYNILQAAVASGERVFKVLDDDSALPVKDTPEALGVGAGSVRFEDVSFSYESDKAVLKDISFELKPGQRFAFVGPTGSGKSTIINLLCRFYDPQAGRILLDGKDLTELDPQHLRRRIGVVLQDVFLFEGTVRENLSLGDSDLGDDTLHEAITAVQAEDVVKRLGGLDGRIRERGATLSTGEKQLLAFARTLAHDPGLLVLDEATAHIDTETELLLQAALDRLLEGRSAIVIAHRLSTIKECDRILVVHHGDIREQGTHDELIAQNGIYARLHRLQFVSSEP